MCLARRISAIQLCVLAKGELSSLTGKTTTSRRRCSSSNAVSNSFSTQLLAMELADRTNSIFPVPLIASSIVSLILAPIGMSFGANQHRTPWACRSA